MTSLATIIAQAVDDGSVSGVTIHRETPDAVRQLVYELLKLGPCVVQEPVDCANERERWHQGGVYFTESRVWVTVATPMERIITAA